MPATQPNQSAESTRSLAINRIVHAPRQLVFDVWTKPAHLKKWWGPKGFTTSFHKMDFRTGGEWNFIMHGPDGTDYRNKNVFLEVKVPERIVYDHLTGPKHRTTITFKEVGPNKTEINMVMIFDTTHERDQAIKTFGADEGLKQTIERLQHLVERGLLDERAADDSLVFERFFNAPPEVVWKAISTPDQIRSWYFDLPGFRAEAGYEFEFLGGKDPDHPFKHLCRVQEAIPLQRLSYTWRYEGYPGNSLVTFELTPREGGTLLKLMHEGLENFPSSVPDFAKGNFVEGWMYLMHTGLKTFLENVKN